MPGIPPKNKTIVFDLDDTLYAERDYVLSGYDAVCRRLSPDPGVAAEMRNWLWKRFLAGRADGAFNALSLQFSLDLDKPTITELIRIYRNHSPSITPREGMRDLLRKLGDHVKLGIVSDGFLPAQQLKLDALGLSEYFDAVIFTESLGRESWKPSPNGFNALCDQLQVAHVDCTYVGDNPSKDFAAPNALNWRTVQLLLDGQIHSHKTAPLDGEAQIVVNSVKDLTALLT